jgi:hypothetical protein
MSRDPFPGWQTLPASQHGYSYVHNNPVNLTDPSGEAPHLIAAAALCAANPLCVVGVGGVVVIGAVWLVVGPQVADMVAPLFTDMVHGAERAIGKVDEDIELLYGACVNWLESQRAQRQPTPRQSVPLTDLVPLPHPTPQSQHIFYFTDVGHYPWPGRDTNQLVSYLSDYENTISGVWGVRSQLETAQRSYNNYGSSFGPRLMGCKFEAERVIFYADRAALGSANSTAKGVDLFPTNFDPIQFIQVKWSAGPMPLRTIQEVANAARRFPSGTYLVESNNLSTQSRTWLEERGGRELPPSIALP